MSTEAQICPFCATQVPAGFSVCSGCGANYRTNIADGIKGIICAGIMAVIFMGLGSAWGGFYLLAALMVAGGFGHMMSMKPRWYRRNA